MSKANQKSRFSVVPLFNLMPDASRNIVYLDHQEVIDKIPRVEHALQDIKARKREEKHLINLMGNKGVWTRVHLRPPKYNAHKHSDQIQRGFDITEKWNNEE